MLRGIKADYNEIWFYTKDGYIYQKFTDKIIDVMLCIRSL